jgi:hypothetical protein
MLRYKKHVSNDYTIVKILIDLINNKYLISILYSNPYEDVEDTVENININNKNSLCHNKLCYILYVYFFILYYIILYYIIL